ncbi:MAG: TolB-like protein [Flavobacteriales bacterium]|jgi:TolB-like protein
MKISNLALLICMTLFGCSSVDSGLFDDQSTENIEVQLSEEENQAYLMVPQLPNTMNPLEASVRFQKNYKTSAKVANPVSITALQNNVSQSRNINHYVRGIMLDLISNFKYVGLSSNMAVSSFVFLDSDYATSDLLGFQIAESFIHEIHKFGIPIIDFKATGSMRVTESGDFVLSRNYLELQADQPIKYVLLGTLAKHQDGVLVNARIVSMESKEVVATAQGFLPLHITKSLINKKIKNEIKLVSD